MPFSQTFILHPQVGKAYLNPTLLWSAPGQITDKYGFKPLVLSFNCKTTSAVLPHRTRVLHTGGYDQRQAYPSTEGLFAVPAFPLQQLSHWAIFNPIYYPIKPKEKLPDSFHWQPSKETSETKAPRAGSIQNSKDPGCMSSELCTCFWQGSRSYLPFPPQEDPLYKG